MELTKREFFNKYGFWPHEEKCKNCNVRRAAHTVWNTSNKCEKFEGTGEKA